MASHRPSRAGGAGRLDQLLVARGLFPSREQARRAVMAGEVRVGGEVVDKPGAAVVADAHVELAGPKEPFASRAGRKLAAALDHFGLDPAGWTCLDVGASTGGFTDCLLSRGARRVYALDVGYGQLDQRLRSDPRVVVMERVNARRLGARDLPERCRLIVVDVSFISLLKVVPALLPHLEPGGWLLPLIKPQFEAGRAEVGKGGVVRDEEVRRRVVEVRAREIAALGAAGGLELIGAFDSPVAGAEGNRETFALYGSPPSPSVPLPPRGGKGTPPSDLSPGGRGAPPADPSPGEGGARPAGPLADDSLPPGDAER